MDPTLDPRPSQRLVSLDVFRGMTIAGMILVNNPGSWRHIYGPLRHAEWNGLTPTDLVFPFFLFIVGVAMTFSFDRRIARGDNRLRLFEHVVRRSIILFLLGLIMYSFPRWRLMGPYVLIVAGLSFLFVHPPPFRWPGGGRQGAYKIVAGVLLVAGVVYAAADWAHFEETNLRVPGVLQRIAVCYFCASLVALTCGVRGRALWTVACLIAYGVMVKTCAAPEDYAQTAMLTSPDGLLHDWIDVKVLGSHLYRHRPDPEGILSTLPAIATVLLGVLTGSWLHGDRDPKDKAIGLFFLANIALVAGLCLDPWFPINKKIWSCAYVLATAGLALHLLAMCYFAIDIRGYTRWGWPFMVFGMNAIAAYFASTIMAILMGGYGWTTEAGTRLTVKKWTYENLCASWAGPISGSLLFAIGYVLLWLLLMTPLYRKRIFFKV